MTKAMTFIESKWDEHLWACDQSRADEMKVWVYDRLALCVVIYATFCQLGLDLPVAFVLMVLCPLARRNAGV